MVSCGHQIIEADDDRLPPPQTFYMPEARYRPPLDHVLVHHYHTVRNSDGSEGARPTSRWMDWTGKLARISSMLNGLPDERLDLTADGLRIFVIPECFEHDGVEAFLDWVTDLDNESACYGLEQGQQVTVPIPGTDFEIRQPATMYGLCTWLDLHPNISRVELRHHIVSYIAGGFIEDTEEACYRDFDETGADPAQALTPIAESDDAESSSPGRQTPAESDTQDQAWQVVDHDGTAHSDHSDEADEPAVTASPHVTGHGNEPQESSAPTPRPMSYAAALKTPPAGRMNRHEHLVHEEPTPQW